MYFAAVLCAMVVGTAHGAQFKIKNVMGGDIWVGILTSQNGGNLEGGGFVLGAQQERDVNAPDNWQGRIWARTWCNPGNNQCETGDCGRKLQCQGSGGEPPATLAEFNLKSNDGQDYYDISLVDGYNVGVSIEPVNGNGDCKSLHCPNDLNNNCPNELKKPGSGGTVACFSACSKYHGDAECCAGQYNTKETCHPDTWRINSAKYFKDHCPDAYSYAFDDASSLKTCSASAYKVTFG